MKCPRCQHENRPTASFCEDCADPLNEVSPLTESNAHSESRAESLTRALAESRAQQTATSEILRIISTSPANAQPVFETILESAVRLCDGVFGAVASFDGETMQLLAAHNWTPTASELSRRMSPGPERGSMAGRAILDRAMVHVPDVELDPEWAYPELSREIGFRSALTVPMLRDGVPLGVIAVGRAERGPFADTQIELLKTFADQAVIAIENVRLFNELQEKNQALTQAHGQVSEALDQQTATSEIPRVISGSPTDIQPVFDTIVKSAARLCDGVTASLCQFDGALLHWVSQHNNTAEGLDAMRRRFPRPLGRDTIVGRAIIDRNVIHVRDCESDPDVPVESREIARAYGYRNVISVPMLREEQPIGAILVARAEAGLFSEWQIVLLQTFADQAVIAIENVRLFNELQEKNQALTTAYAQVTEALDQQTATAEVLRVISRSPTNVQPVFETILERAVALCGARNGSLFRFDGELVHVAAHFNLPSAVVEIIARQFPSPPNPRTASGRTILSRRVITIEDVLTDENYESAAPLAGGFRSMLGVPLLRDGSPTGALVIVRGDPGPFRTSRLRCCRPLPIRRSSLSRTCGCLPSCRGRIGRSLRLMLR